MGFFQTATATASSKKIDNRTFARILKLHRIFKMGRNFKTGRNFKMRCNLEVAFFWYQNFSKNASISQAFTPKCQNKAFKAFPQVELHSDDRCQCCQQQNSRFRKKPPPNRFFSKKFSLIIIWAFRLHRPGTIQLAAEALVSRLKSLLVI